MILKNALRLGLLSAALLGASAVSAQTITIGTASGLRSTTIDVPVTFTAGATPAAGFNTVFSYDPTPLSGDPVSSNGSCNVNNVTNTVDVIVATFPAAAIPSGPVCTISFPIGAAAGFAVYPLTHDPDPAATAFNDLAANVIPGTVEDGSFEVVDTPPEPPVITFSPNGGAVTLAQGGGGVGAAATNGTITVTAAGGIGGGTGSYNCAVPAGFTVSNNANAAFANGSADMTVGCTMAAAATSAGMTCAVTDLNGARNVDFTLGCPAGASAVYSSAPAAGGALGACNGAAGATVNTTLTINNIGTPANPDSAADDLALACSVTGTGFAIASGPASPLEAGDSTTVTVECTIPAAGTENGTLTCNGNDYPLSASVRTAPVLSSPALVPSTSFWSKMILFGLLAGLGMLVVSLRRNG